MNRSRPSTPQRRQLLGAGLGAGLLSCVAAPLAAVAQPAATPSPVAAGPGPALAAMTDGPFYPPRAWRERWDDWDADLTRVLRNSNALRAKGEWLGLEMRVLDSQGKALDNAEVEIWQCDALRSYHHPQVNAQPDRTDPGFQGFGATRSDGQGRLRFLTIKPVPYPGRTPHIHVKLRHASFGEISSQLFLAGDPGNPEDFLWRRLSAGQQAAQSMHLQPAIADSGLRWSAQQLLRVPT